MRLPVILLPDGGHHVVDLVHADDLAEAHLLLMAAGQSGELYNVTDGRYYQMAEPHTLDGPCATPLSLATIHSWELAVCVRPWAATVGRL